MERLTIRAARRFILLKQGLIGERRFKGKAGAYEYLRQAGCIQFDPVDSCGRNAELTLQSRVGGFTKKMLYDLIYKDRLLFDYTDKELSILPVETWPYFKRCREKCAAHALRFSELSNLKKQALDYIYSNGPTDAASLPIAGETEWFSAIHWSGNWHGKAPAARSVLEQLYTEGALMIHHKDGVKKSYELVERCLPPELIAAPDPIPDEFEHLKWRVLRRIGAVGLIWNRRSDAFLGLELPAELRTRVFSELVRDGLLIEVKIDRLRPVFYIKAEDAPLAALAASDKKLQARCEFIAPLDPFLWDRRLINELFNFSYTWEIYTPAAKRKYGSYTLPVIYSEGFAGRIEATADYKKSRLVVKNIWYEADVRQTKALASAIAAAVRRFARFNNCQTIEYL